MSDQDIEVVRRIHEEFLKGFESGENIAAAFDAGLVAPEFKLIALPGVPGMRDVYEGRAEFVEFVETWTEDFNGTMTVEEMTDLGGGRVLVVFRHTASGKASEVPVNLEVSGVWTVESGQAVRSEHFLDRADAIAAARSAGGIGSDERHDR